MPAARTSAWNEGTLRKVGAGIEPRVWLGIFLYAVFAGLAIQLVVLPYLFPQLHAGNGLLGGRDWVGFHEQAVVMAQKIEQGGWGEFLLRPDGDNAITGVASFFYVVFGPHPWTLLPLSAAMFATGGVALFSMLKYLDLEDNEAIIALLPYLVFPSGLLQYGQIHKDVFCTAGVLVTLWSWVSLLRHQRQPGQVPALLAVGAVGLVVLSVFRPYFMFPFLGLGVLLLIWYIGRVGWQVLRLAAARRGNENALPGKLRFDLGSVLVLIVINIFIYFMSITYLDIRLRPVPFSDRNATFALPVLAWKSNETVRSADAVRVLSASVFSEAGVASGGRGGGGAASAEAARLEVAKIEAAILKAIQECRPVVVLREGAFLENMMNRMFLKIAVARAGFTSSGGTTAASNIDKGIDFCKNEDLIRYVPRALQIAFFAPFPASWAAVEKRNSSSVEIYISAVEMFYCYVAYIGLIYWLVSYSRWNVALVVPIAFALGLSLLLGLTVANIGTLYRMRFPFVMIFVTIGMAGMLQLAKIRPPWVDPPGTGPH